MKRIAWVLGLIGLLIAFPAGALRQSDLVGLLPDTYAFDYTFHLAVDGLDTFALSVDLSGSGALDRIARTFAVSAGGDLLLGSAQHESVSAELRLLDDSLYLNPGDGWQAHAGASAYAADLIYQYAALTADPAALAQWEASAVDGVSAIVTALMGVDPAAFLSSQRLDDESFDGVQTAHTRSIVDFQALMQTDGFVEAVAAFASAQGNDLIVVAPDELAAIVLTNSIFFENVTLTIDQYVGLDDGMLHRLMLTLNMPLDPMALGYDTPPFMVTATFDVTLSAFNQPQNITAPDHATAVEQFYFPVPPESELPGSGVAHYLYFETIGDGETYTGSFEGQAGDVVTITVRGLGLSFDTYLQLLAPGGEVVIENDDYEGSPFGMGYYDSQIVGFVLPESGTYSITVSELSGGAGSFALTLSIER